MSVSQLTALVEGMDGDLYDFPDDPAALRAMIADMRLSQASLQAKIAALKAAPSRLARKIGSESFRFRGTDVGCCRAASSKRWASSKEPR